MLSTAFLVGPMFQLERMFDKVRIVATIIFFLAMGLTIFVAIKVALNDIIPLCYVLNIFFAL